MPEEESEIGNGFYDIDVDKSAEEDALDTMLETSVVELDEALKLGGIGNYNPQTSLDEPSAPTGPEDPYIPVDPEAIPQAASPATTHALQPGRTALQPESKISSPPKIAILAKDEVFQSALAQSPPRRASKTRRASNIGVQPPSVVFPTGDASSEHRTGRWTLDEKVLFLYGLQKYGQGKWKQIQSYCPGRSLIQIKSHGQKVIKRLRQGDNVFRKMEEHCARLHYLVTRIHTGNNIVRTPELPAPKNPEHILVASALCQLGDDAQQQTLAPTKQTAETPTLHSVSTSPEGS